MPRVLEQNRQTNQKNQINEENMERFEAEIRGEMNSRQPSPNPKRLLQESFCLEEPGLLMGNVRAPGSQQWQEIPLDAEHFL